MIQLSEYFSPQAVFSYCPSDIGEFRRSLIDAVLSSYSEGFRQSAHEGVLEDLNRAEVPLAPGIVLSHLRMDDLDALRIGAALCSQAVTDAKGNPVHLMVFSAIPKSAVREYLRVLSRLSRFLNTEEVKSIYREGDAHGFTEAIHRFDKEA